jgi:ubiquinone biosynthesis protein
MENQSRNRRTVTDPVRETFTRVSDVFHASLDLVANVLENINQLVTDVREDSLEIARESEELYHSAGERAGNVRDAVRAAPRFGRILKEGLWVLASYRVHAAKARMLSPEGAAGELEALHRRNAERLRDLCLELRGGALKLGQFVSCRMDLLPEPYVVALSELQDRVPAVSYDAIAERIEHELGAPVDELFARFDEEPLAAASLAQVHAAELPDGTDVAVKVQVPGIEEIIEIDLAAMRVLASVFGEVFPGVDSVAITTELARSVREELDFTDEAENAAEFAANNAGRPGVVVARVIPELTCARVMTMERIDGERLTDFLDGCAERGEEGAADRDRILGIMLESFCAQVLSQGLFHADPHPGNFLVCHRDDGPALAVLDFGCVQRFDAELRHTYARLVAATLARNEAEMGDLLAELGFRTEDGRPDGLIEIAHTMLELFADGGVDLSTIDPKEQLERAMRAARDNPIAEVPQHFVLLGRVFGALGGLLMHYRPNLDLFSIITPHMSTALSYAPRA